MDSCVANKMYLFIFSPSEMCFYYATDYIIINWLFIGNLSLLNTVSKFTGL